MRLNRHEELAIPSHVTGFFVPRWASDPLETGSVGAGLVLEPGISFGYRRSGRSSVRLNGQDFRSEALLGLLPQEIEVRVRSELPVGAGYAMSASLALACSISAELAAGGLDLLGAFRRAHVAEVRAMTGLGDVLALHGGRGLVVRLKPGAPGIGEVQVIDVPEDVVVVSAVLGSMSTTEMLTRYADRIRHHGSEAFRRFLSDPSLERFLECSRDFARGVGFLTPDLEERVLPIRDLLLGYSVKKRVLFAVTPLKHLEEVASHLSSEFGQVRVQRVGDGTWLRYLEAILAIAR